MFSDPMYLYAQSYLSGYLNVQAQQYEPFVPTLRIETIWEDYRGNGVTIAPFEAVDRLHPELIANYDTSSLDIYDPLDDIVAGGAWFGTFIAGLAAADDDGLGMVGVAPDAAITSREGWASGTADILTAYFNAEVFGPAPMADFADGRDGLGRILITANEAGLFYNNGTILNGASNAQQDNSNDPHIITFSGLTLNQQFPFFNSRTTGGPMTLASVPMDTVSYEPPDALNISSFRPYQGEVAYTLGLDPRGDLGTEAGEFSFVETEGGTPLPPAGDYLVNENPLSAMGVGAGVVALMLEANPDLGWRDVQDIIAHSATLRSINLAYTDPEANDLLWQMTQTNTKNGGGLFHHPV